MVDRIGEVDGEKVCIGTVSIPKEYEKHLRYVKSDGSVWCMPASGRKKKEKNKIEMAKAEEPAPTESEEGTDNVF